MANKDFSAMSVEGQFVEHPHKKVIDQKTHELIDRLLERIPLAGITHAVLVSEQ